MGFTRTTYQVMEGIGFLQICAAVFSPSGDCPINFDFSVEFSTENGIAGGRNGLWLIFCCMSQCFFFFIESPMDYGSVTTTLPFAACEDMSCQNISIVDDEVLENTESFFATLERNGLDSRITLNPTRAEIEILDDDSEF